MATRNMSPKGFLHKASGKISAEAFLAQHRAWLETGELALFTTPILLRLDSRELLPTPALQEIKEVVLAHHLAEEVRLAEEAMNATPKSKVHKNYLVTIYNSKGEVQTHIDSTGKEKELISSFDTGSLAQGWADRRLFEGSPDWFAVVQHTKMFDRAGDPLATNIMRDDSIGRILKVSKGPVMKSKPQSSSRLGFGVKAKQSHAHFSKG
jgi:hypothetical protein